MEEAGEGKGKVGFIPEFVATVFAAEASGMEDGIVGNQFLHRVDDLIT